MKLLITGAFEIDDELKTELQAAGYELFYHGDEREAVPCPERYEAVICNGLFLYNPIESFTSLRLIQLTSAGMDRVPLDYIREHGIRIFNARGVYSVPMAEWTIGKLLEIYKNTRAFYDKQQAHIWEKDRSLRELQGRTALLVGCGSVGMEVAKRLCAFGVTVIGIDVVDIESEYMESCKHFYNIDETLPTADIVILTCPLTDETRGLIDERRLSLMKDDAVLINISRGAVVDAEALNSWARGNRKAAIDVFDPEPLPPKSPLWQNPNILITPHNSFVGNNNSKRIHQLIRRNLL